MSTSTDQPITAEQLCADFRASLARERREERARRARFTARAIKAGVVTGVMLGIAMVAGAQALTDDDLTPDPAAAAFDYCYDAAASAPAPMCR